MSDNVIDFQSATARRASLPTEPAEPFKPRVTGRQRAGRKRNPLRHPYNQMSLAVVAAGKLHRGEVLRRDDYVDALSWFRRGAEAAGLLAEEFERGGLSNERQHRRISRLACETAKTLRKKGRRTVGCRRP
jgi:hypothetical protein